MVLLHNKIYLLIFFLGKFVAICPRASFVISVSLSSFLFQNFCKRKKVYKDISHQFFGKDRQELIKLQNSPSHRSQGNLGSCSSMNIFQERPVVCVCDRVSKVMFGFTFNTFCDWLKKLAPPTQPKPSATWSLAFSRLLRQLRGLL